MADAKQFRIKSFPEDNGYWRIDWMDDIHYNPSAPSEQLIKVFLTKLQWPEELELINPLSPRVLDTVHRRIVEIGVGLLPLVWTGSVWQNGYRIEDGVISTKREFKIDTAFSKPIKFSDKSNPLTESRLIPATKYPLGFNSWQTIQNSPLIALKIGNDPYGLLLPAIEVIRFYYIYSSYSARALYYGQYEYLIEEFKCTHGTKLPHVTLRIKRPALHEDAWVLARYLASKAMQSRVKNIYEWVQRRSLGNIDNQFPESVFPFDGTSSLQVEGVSIKGDDGLTRFLGVRLRSCTHKMPYSGVSILIDENPTNTDGSEQERPNWLTTWPTGLDPDSLPFDHSEEPDKKLARMLLDANEGRFSALSEMELEKIYAKSGQRITHRKKKVQISDEIKNGLSTSEGRYIESNLRPVDINQNVIPEDHKTPPTLKSFLESLNFLRANNLKVNTIGVGEKREVLEGEIINHFQKKGRSNRQWSVIRSGATKLRGFIVAKVCTANGCAYVMEIERNPSGSENFSILIIALPNFRDITNDEFNNLARSCELNGRWPPENEMRKYRREVTTHRNLPDANLGKRLLAALLRIGLVSNVVK